VTKPKVVFDPFSEEFFNNPFEIYRRMREDAPLYYDEEEDFYALTRHEDVAAAFKDFETYSSARGCDLAMVRKGVPVEQKSIIFMDPPEHRHMRSLLNKAFTPRAIQSQTETIVEVVDKYLGAVDPDYFDIVQDFSGPFPVEVIGTGSTPACTANRGRWRSTRPACRPTSTARCTTSASSRSAARSRRRTL
jgi:cytochrome P450